MAKAFTGRTKFVADVASEQAEELRIWREQKRAADQARADEAGAYNLWSIIGTVLALPFVGPSAPLFGATIGNIAKSGYVDESADVMDPSDVGTWNVASNREALEVMNQEFRDYDTAEFWGGMKDIGTAAMFAYSAGGGMGLKGPTPENFSPFKWGGETGMTTGEIWNKYWDKG
jgi:hypothetical protein